MELLDSVRGKGPGKPDFDITATELGNFLEETLNCKLQVTSSKLSINIGTLRGKLAEFPAKQHPLSMV